jgi:hypothetical protein
VEARKSETPLAGFLQIPLLQETLESWRFQGGLPIYIIGGTGKSKAQRGIWTISGWRIFIRTPWSCVLCYALAENGRVFSWSCHT